MKKRFLLAGAALLLSLVACNKSKECSCTVTQVWHDIGEPMVTTFHQTIKKGKCSDLNMQQTMQAGGDTYEQNTDCIEI